MEIVTGALWTKSSSKSRKLESSHLKIEVIITMRGFQSYRVPPVVASFVRCIKFRVSRLGLFLISTICIVGDLMYWIDISLDFAF